MKQFIWALIALLGLLVLGTLGFLYSILRSIIRSILGRKGGLWRYYKSVAISLDHSGGVVCQDMLNDLLVKPNGHRFGDEKESVSKVLGINEFHFSENRLYPLGRRVARFTNKVFWSEKGKHTWNAYEKWKSTKNL